MERMIRSGFERSRGSEAAGGCTVKEPSALRIVRPFCFTAASVLVRNRKDTERFAFAKCAPKYPPTDPAPTMRICFIKLLRRIMTAYYTTQVRRLEMRYNSRNNQVDRLKAFRGRASCATRFHPCLNPKVVETEKALTDLVHALRDIF